MDHEITAQRPQDTEPLTAEAVNLGILEDHLGFHLRLANDRTFEFFTELLGTDRLRPGCFTMLILIANNPGITQVAITRACGRDKSSVAKALRYMEDEGLIRRERVTDDRRSSASFLTTIGTERVKRLQDKSRIQGDRVRELIGDKTTVELLDILKYLIRKLT